MQTPVLNARIEGQVGDLQIEATLDTRGGPLVLVGPNGSGKTSVLLMLLGVLRPRSARIAIGSTTLLDTASGLEVAVEHRRLGYVPQDYALFPHMTVRENVLFALRSSTLELSEAAISQKIDALVAEFNLPALVDRRANTLSGGEKQRVALARALAIEPRALLLDEPLAALDIGARREVRASLATRLTALSLPTVVVTHDPADARALGHRIAVLQSGRIAQVGTWDELRAHPACAFVEEFVALGQI